MHDSISYVRDIVSIIISIFSELHTDISSCNASFAFGGGWPRKGSNKKGY